MTLAAELEAIAIAVAREGGDLARRRRSEGVAIAATKSALADIVTEADREVETLIRDRIAVARPDDGFLGEEGGTHAGTSGITWVVDPIDGTVNYAFGIPAYATSVAAVTGTPTPGEWEVLAGVVYSPAQGELFHAAAGHGAWLDGRQLSVNAAPGPAGALLATGFGYDAATHAAASCPSPATSAASAPPRSTSRTSPPAGSTVSSNADSSPGITPRPICSSPSRAVRSRGSTIRSAR